MRQLFWGCLDTMSAYKEFGYEQGSIVQKMLFCYWGNGKNFFLSFRSRELPFPGAVVISWPVLNFSLLRLSIIINYIKNSVLWKKPAHLFFDMRKKWEVNSDKNPLTRMTRTPHLKQGSLDHGLNFPLSCNVENPFYFKVPLGSGKICTAQLAATVCFLCTN